MTTPDENSDGLEHHTDFLGFDDLENAPTETNIEFDSDEFDDEDDAFDDDDSLDDWDEGDFDEEENFSF